MFETTVYRYHTERNLVIGKLHHWTFIMSETLGVFRSRASDLFKLHLRTVLGWTYRISEILGYTVQVVEPVLNSL